MAMELSLLVHAEAHQVNQRSSAALESRVRSLSKGSKGPLELAYTDTSTSDLSKSILNLAQAPRPQAEKLRLNCQKNAQTVLSRYTKFCLPPSAR